MIQSSSKVTMEVDPDEKVVRTRSKETRLSPLPSLFTVVDLLKSNWGIRGTL